MNQVYWQNEAKLSNQISLILLMMQNTKHAAETKRTKLKYMFLKYCSTVGQLRFYIFKLSTLKINFSK